MRFPHYTNTVQQDSFHLVVLTSIMKSVKIWNKSCLRNKLGQSDFWSLAMTIDQMKCNPGKVSNQAAIADEFSGFTHNLNTLRNFSLLHLGADLIRKLLQVDHGTSILNQNPTNFSFLNKKLTSLS